MALYGRSVTDGIQIQRDPSPLTGWLPVVDVAPTITASQRLVGPFYRLAANGQSVEAVWTAETIPPTDVIQGQIMAAIDQAKIDMQAIIDTADIPAGTLTSAQLSSFVRTAQTQLKSVALRVKQIAKLLDGDFTSST